MTVIDSIKATFQSYFHAKPAGNGKTSLEIDNSLVAAMQTYGPFVVAAVVASQAIVPFSASTAGGYFLGQPLKGAFDQIFSVWNQQNFAIQIAAGGLVSAGAILTPLPTALLAGGVTGVWAEGKMPPAEALAWVRTQTGL